uniref:uncharacterized protein LOC117260706 isoform X4 n=1 Tax=Epinephelus lanceolatus TaxID=310571 RepID=UPI00144728C8|nr:uncharacterized protein LOC117260706 isoform X4 [Epinephelus lanceolatus]
MQEEFTCRSRIEYVGGKAEEQPLSPPSPIRLDEVALEPETSESDDSTDDSTEETLETLPQMQEEFTCRSRIEYVGGKAEEQPLSPPSPIRLDEVALEPETSESDDSTDDSTEETLETLPQMQEEFTCRSRIEYVGGKAEEQPLSPPSPIRLAVEPETFEPDDSTEETLETLQQVREKLLMTETVLQPLAHLPRVTRFSLFQSLSALSEDSDALTLLKKKIFSTLPTIICQTVLQ